jgi:hypothetical protein
MLELEGFLLFGFDTYQACLVKILIGGGLEWRKRTLASIRQLWSLLNTVRQGQKIKAIQALRKRISKQWVIPPTNIL